MVVHARVLELDHVRTAALDVRFIPTAWPNLFALERGTGLLLPLAIHFSTTMRIRSFALRAPWLTQGGRWSTIDPAAKTYRLKSPGRVLDIGADLALNFFAGFDYPLRPGNTRRGS